MSLFKLLRPHHWSKNSLILLPALAGGHIGDRLVLSNLFISIVLFSLVASAGYIFNDILDCENDLTHPRKKKRPIASGTVSINTARWVAATCLLISIGCSFFLSTQVTLILTIYILISGLYTRFLKKLFVIDLLVLLLLYTLRIITGIVISPAGPTTWLFLFIFFIFLSLAILKRSSEVELTISLNKTSIAGRAYTPSHYKVLTLAGICSSATAVLILFLYTMSEAISLAYSSPLYFLVFPVALAYWLASAWISVKKNQILCDPIVYAFKHYSTYVCALVCIPCYILAQM